MTDEVGRPPGQPVPGPGPGTPDPSPGPGPGLHGPGEPPRHPGSPNNEAILLGPARCRSEAALRIPFR